MDGEKWIKARQWSVDRRYISWYLRFVSLSLTMTQNWLCQNASSRITTSIPTYCLLRKYDNLTVVVQCKYCCKQCSKIINCFTAKYHNNEDAVSSLVHEALNWYILFIYHRFADNVSSPTSEPLVVGSNPISSIHSPCNSVVRVGVLWKELTNIFCLLCYFFHLGL